MRAAAVSTMSAEKIDIFNKSLERIDAVDDFFERFYRRFIAANPTVAKMFHGTDMEQQYKMLKDSMDEMRKFYFEHEESSYLAALGRVHASRDLQVTPYLFDVWLNCLVDTVGALDPSYSDEVGDAWRAIMAPGIGYMKTWSK